MEHVRYHFNSFDRVRNETAPYVNERIDREIEGNIAHYSQLDDYAITKRIAELDHEWDIDRALMANFALLGGAAFTAGLTKNKNWFYLLGAQFVFLMLHAVKGWCPPVTVMRRMGFRTKTEIESEKATLLKILESRSPVKETRQTG